MKKKKFEEKFEEILKNTNLSFENKYLLRQSLISTLFLEEGFYYSKESGITQVRFKDISLNGSLMGCRVWDISENSDNMRIPSWIKENAKKIDLEKLDKCPLCNGTGKVVFSYNFRYYGSSDFSYDTDVGNCIFCEEFKKWKK